MFGNTPLVLHDVFLGVIVDQVLDEASLGLVGLLPGHRVQIDFEFSLGR